jgi:pimeloyl-ACP methyl ester carboxylesterase
LRAGSGPPLLLLHGLLGYSFSWRYALPALGQISTVYAVDMLGVGFSDRPRDLDCSLRASAERLLRFLDEAALAGCDLLGTSHGGAVAMMASALAPQRIRRLILAAPVNPWSAHGRGWAAFLSRPVVARVLAGVVPRLGITYGFLLRRLYGDPRRIRPGTLEGYAAPLAIPGAFEYGLSVLRSWNRDLTGLKALLPGIAHIPALLIWGSLDTAVCPSSAETLSRQFDHCRLVMLEGVGHLPYEEVPEEFNRAVLEFLYRRPCPT